MDSLAKHALKCKSMLNNTNRIPFLKFFLVMFIISPQGATQGQGKVRQQAFDNLSFFVISLGHDLCHPKFRHFVFRHFNPDSYFFPWQFFGVFPARVSSDYMEFELNPKMLLVTLTVKAIFVSVIMALVYACLVNHGFTFEDVFERTSSNESFSRTDFFSIVAHFCFLQAITILLCRFIFFINHF